MTCELSFSCKAKTELFKQLVPVVVKGLKDFIDSLPEPGDHIFSQEEIDAIKRRIALKKLAKRVKKYETETNCKN